MDMYTTSAPPTGSLEAKRAWLVWAHGNDLDEIISKLGTKAAAAGATAIVGLQITMADSSHHVPAEPTTYRSGITAYNDSGHAAGSTSWTVYGTAVSDKPQPTSRLERKGEGFLFSTSLPESFLD